MAALLNFLNQVLPPDGDGYRCWVAIKNKRIQGQGFTSTNEDLSKVLAGIDARGADAYFACSTFKDPTKRTQDNVRSAKTLRLDVDAGKGKPYADVEAAKDAITKYVSDTGLPSPLLVCSGNGVHVYWILDRAIGSQEWEAAAIGLKKLCQERGLHADPSVTADSARILRPIETLNWKNPEEPREVYLIQDSVPVPLSAIMDRINPVRVPSVDNSGLGAAILGGLGSGPYEPSLAELSANHCSQLQQFRNTRGNIDEPLWYAGLGVLAYCEDGERCAQEWSNGHPDYNPAATARKLEQARTAAGPTTCARFRSLNPDGCKGCPHSITSPIQLGKSQAIVTPPFIGDDKTTPPLPEGFKYGPNQQIFARVKDKDADPGEDKFVDVLLCQYPFYIASVREQETKGVAGGQSVKITTRTPHTPWKSFTIDRDTLKGPGWLGALAKYGVDCEPGMEKPFGVLIHRMIKWRTAMEKMETSFKSFGWKDNRSGFVAGRKLYTKQGVKDVSGTAELEKASDLICPKQKGSLNKWREAANKVFVKGCEPQAFAMLCSFAAPLMDLLYAADEGGTIVSLVSSKSGQGKTVAILAAETVWGQAKCLRLTDMASLVAKFRAIGVRCNLPVVIDEWGDADTDTLCKFSKAFTGGLDKSRLTMSGEDTREQLDWKTVMIGTTNMPLVGLLNQANHNAQAMRIFEVPVAIPEHLAKNQSANLQQEFEDNAGYAGPVFLMHLLKNYNLDDLREKANRLANEFGARLGANTDTRFKTRLIAAAAIAALILTKAEPGYEPLLEFNPANIINWALSVVKDSMSSAYTNQKENHEHLMDFIMDNMNNFVVVPHRFNAKVPYYEAGIVIPKGKLMGRYERQEAKLYVPHSIMHKFAISVRVPFMEFSKDLSSRGLVLNRNRQTHLTAGVDKMTAVKASCWEIDLTHQKVEEAVSAIKDLGVNDKLKEGKS